MIIDAVWIIFNVLVWIGLIIAFLGILLWLIKVVRLGILIVVALVLVIIFSNIGNKSPVNTSSREISFQEETYTDIKRLNIFQEDDINIYTPSDSSSTFEYSSSVEGIMAGVYWENVSFYGERINTNEIRYNMKKKKRYFLLNIPIFSKVVSFDGVASLIKL